jgi:tetratricopeptide (TPR) repeat protein
MKNFKTILPFFLCMFCVSCFQDTYSERKDFNLKFKDADEAVMAGNLPQAEKDYFSALSIAEKMKWNGGIVSARGALATLYSSQKQFSKAEENLVEARDLCKNDSSCYGLGSIYDGLVLIDLFELRDVGKAEANINEVILQRQRLNEESDVKSMLLRYADEMTANGFDLQAEQLVSRANSL